MKQFINELRKFSKENWWVFVLLSVALVIVYITGKGDLTEIIILFLANFIGNIFIMMMQNNYTNGSNKIGSKYYLVSLFIFISIGTYGFIYLNQSQYLVWQLAYTLAGLKAYLYYNHNRDIKILSEKSFIPLNIILFIIFIKYFDYQNYSILQAIGFSLITTGLVSIQDKVRYWLNLIGIGALTFGSLWGVINSYYIGSIDGVALGFFCLTGTVLVYYIKLIKKYI